MIANNGSIVSLLPRPAGKNRGKAPAKEWRSSSSSGGGFGISRASAVLHPHFLRQAANSSLTHAYYTWWDLLLLPALLLKLALYSVRVPSAFFRPPRTWRSPSATNNRSTTMANDSSQTKAPSCGRPRSGRRCSLQQVRCTWY